MNFTGVDSPEEQAPATSISARVLILREVVGQEDATNGKIFSK